MDRQIPERDWKAWRGLSDEALQRFCQRILEELGDFVDGEGTPHERYLKMYQKMKQRDREIAEVFDAPARSRAYTQIALAVRRRLVKKSELLRFTEETQNVVSLLLGE